MNKRIINFEAYTTGQKEKGLFGEFSIREEFITIGEIVYKLTNKQKILLIERLLDNIYLTEDEQK